ncbi:MAG: nicotinamide riboside transporter PnuC [Candidatus Cryptobacteroides sp.]
MSNNKVLSFYDWFLIVGVIASSAVYSFYAVMSGDDSLSGALLGSVAGIAGVFCVVLVAKGSIWNYLFGVVNVSLYAWISYNASLYGDAALNAFYYFPMQFIGWWQWRRRSSPVISGDHSKSVISSDHTNPVISSDHTNPVISSDQRESRNLSSTVKARRLSWTGRILLVAGCAVAVTVCGFILRHLGDPQPFKDSATTVLSIVAQALMALAFMEQWVLWIVTNIISVVMWVIMATRGEAHAGLMVIMWSFYLLNSINGLRVWLKLSSDAK